MSDIAQKNRQSIDDALASKHHNTNANIVDVEEIKIKLVIFSLDKGLYAFHSHSIAEVLGNVSVYSLPGCPPSLEGVINVRGDIETVISLRAFFDMEDQEDLGKSRILLGKSDAMQSGVRVDQLEEILDIAESKISEPPTSLPDHMAHFVTGVTEFGDENVTVLDLDKIFQRYANQLDTL